MAHPEKTAGAKVLQLTDFLEPPRAEPPAPAADGEGFLEAPDRDGLGAAPAPTLGLDEAPTVVEPGVWFAEVAEPDAPEPATILVPEDILRVAHELREEARERFAPPPPLPMPTVEIDLDAMLEDDDEDKALFAGPLGRLWWRRARYLAPAALCCSAAAVGLAALALSRTPSPREAKPVTTAAPAAQATRAASPVARATPAAPAAKPAPVSVVAAAPAPVARRAHHSRAIARRRHRRLRSGHRLRAPTALRARRDRAAKALRAGRFDFDNDDFAHALRAYARAVRAAPRDPDARFGVALSAYELHRDRTAWHSLERALRLDPDHPGSNVLMGFMMQEAGRDKRAAEYYAHYLKVAPNGEWAGELRSVLSQLGG